MDVLIDAPSEISYCLVGSCYISLSTIYVIANDTNTGCAKRTQEPIRGLIALLTLYNRKVFRLRLKRVLRRIAWSRKTGTREQQLAIVKVRVVSRDPEIAASIFTMRHIWIINNLTGIINLISLVLVCVLFVRAGVIRVKVIAGLI